MSPGENTPAPVPTEGSARNVDVHAEVQMPRISMPLGWVAALLIFVVSGAISVLTVWFGSEARADKNEAALKAHVEDANKHLTADVTKEGGVVSKKTLRVVLGEMKITCRKTKFDDNTEGMACGVKLPKEAE